MRRPVAGDAPVIEILGLGEMAKALRKRRVDVRAMCERGELPATLDGKRWKVPADTLRAHLDAQAKREAAQRQLAHARAQASATPRRRGRPESAPFDLTRYEVAAA